MLKIPIIKTKQEFKDHYKSDMWREAAGQICERHRLSHRILKRAEGTEHIIFLVDDSFVIKIFAPFRRSFEREKAALEFANGKTSLKTPEIIAAGEFEEFKYIVATQLSGEIMTRERWLNLSQKEQIPVLRQLAGGLKELHVHNAGSFKFDWQNFVETQSKIAVQRQIDNQVNPEWIEKLPEFIETNLKLLPKKCQTVFLHGDIHFGNLHLQRPDPDNNWQISGLFDFADSLCGFHEFDFVAIGLLMIQGQGDLQREFFKAYGYADNELDEDLRKRLMLLTILYECSDLRRYAMRLRPEAVDYSFEQLEKAIWSFHV